MLASIASDKPLLCWNRLHQKMNVILIRTNLQKLCLVALLYLRTNIPHYLIYASSKYCPSILRRKHHLIQQHRYIMALMNILAHASTLRPKGRGINPLAIQMTEKFLSKVKA